MLDSDVKDVGSRLSRGGDQTVDLTRRRLQRLHVGPVVADATFIVNEVVLNVDHKDRGLGRDKPKLPLQRQAS